jgi:hypothetical protein
MACLLNTGRKVPCKDSVGGIKAAYFADYDTMGTLTIVSGEVTAFGGTPDFYKFDVKGNSSLEQTITSSRENGTAFYEQTLNLTLTKLDLATQQEIIEIVKARPHVIIEDYNGNYLLIGAVNGADCSGGTIVTGAAMGDLSGFTLTMAGQEKLPAFFVDATIVTAATSATQINP